MIDCEGVPVSGVDACDGETVRDWRMIARCVPGRVDLAEVKAWIDQSVTWLNSHSASPPEPVRVRIDDGFGNIDAEKVREALPGVPVVSHPTIRGAVLVGNDAAARDGRVVITGVPSARAAFDDGIADTAFVRDGKFGALVDMMREASTIDPQVARFGDWPAMDPEKVEAARDLHPQCRGESILPEPVKDLLTRTLEAEADALSFPPAGSEWRNESGRSGVVEYRPNGRGWRLLYSDGGQSEWCYDGIAEGWERVPLEPAPSAPQAVTLETAAINASEPGEYRSPADAHLPNFGVSDG